MFVQRNDVAPDRTPDSTAVPIHFHAMVGIRSIFTVVALCGALFLPTASVNAQQALRNGGFETGDLTGWSAFTLGNGGFFPGDNSQPDGFGGYLTPGTGLSSVGPAAGNAYAVSDASNPLDGGPGARVLLQGFTTPGSFSSLTLSYDMFVNDWNGAGALNTGGLLDPNQANPTQFARVDILTAAADPFSTAAADIVGNFYLGEDAGNPPNLYTSYSYELSSLLTPNTAYQLRFAEVENQFVLNQGVDNVSILATGGSIATETPEPGGPALLTGLGLCGSVLSALRRRRR
jgi:hypothetical protein